MAIHGKIPCDVSDLGLTLKELNFVGEYCANGSDESKALVAAKLAKPDMSPAAIRLRAIDILNRPQVKTAIQRFFDHVLEPYRDRLNNDLLTVLRIRAFYDVSNYVQSNGKPRPLDDISPENRHAIDAVEEDYKGKDADVRVVRYKMADKVVAQKMLIELLKPKAEKASGIPGDRQTFLDNIFSQVTTAAAIAEGAATAGLAYARELNKETKRHAVIPREVAEDAQIVPAEPKVRKATDVLKELQESRRRRKENAVK